MTTHRLLQFVLLFTSASNSTRLRPITSRKMLLLLCLAFLSFPTRAPAQQGKPQAYTLSIPAPDAAGNTLTPEQASASSRLPTFPYTVVSSRDGKTYSG